MLLELLSHWVSNELYLLNLMVTYLYLVVFSRHFLILPFTPFLNLSFHGFPCLLTFLVLLLSPWSFLHQSPVSSSASTKCYYSSGFLHKSLSLLTDAFHLLLCFQPLARKTQTYAFTPDFLLLKVYNGSSLCSLPEIYLVWTSSFRGKNKLEHRTN